MPTKVAIEEDPVTPPEIYAEALRRWMSGASFDDWPYLKGEQIQPCAYISNDGQFHPDLIPVRCILYGPSGAWQINSPASLKQTGSISFYSSIIPLYVGGAAVFLHDLTGSFVSAKIVDRAKTETLNGISNFILDSFGLFVPPQNSIGSPPEPRASQIIPPDSPKVFCNQATVTTPKSGKSVTIVHDQYWAKGPSSYAIVPMAQKRIIVEHRSGVTSASSRQDEISAALEIEIAGEVTAGWATISASISASLSLTTTTTSSITITDESSTMAEDVVRNTTQESGIVVIWQLTDVITLFEKDDHGRMIPCGKLEIAQSPPFIRTYPGDLQFGEPGRVI